MFLELGSTVRILGVILMGLALLVLGRPLWRALRGWLRARTLSQWARRQAGSFHARGDRKLLARLTDMDPLGDSAVSPNIRHVLEWSSSEGRTLVFDHELWVEGHARPLPHTAVLVEDPEMRLPRFEMHPFYPGGGVQVEDASPVVRYRTRAHPDQRRAAKSVFDQVLSGFGDHAGWSVAAGGSRVLCYQAGVQARPEQLSELLEKARAIHALVREAGLSAGARSP